jgi:hypothetical protein
MLKVFIGYDERQPVAYNVLQHSIISKSSEPVAITPLVLKTFPNAQALANKGNPLTPFTYSRFMVPWLCNYEGWALFLDIDMIVLSDIADLFKQADPQYAVQVSKNELKFEWASAILYNCEKCRILTPDFVEGYGNLHRIGWLKDEEVGDFPREWNHLVGYDQPRKDAKLVHYTQGIPCFEETNTSEYTNEWVNEYNMMRAATDWVTLMGPSVHATTYNGRRVPKFLISQFGHEEKLKQLAAHATK